MSAADLARAVLDFGQRHPTTRIDGESLDVVRLPDPCPSHPEDREHECMVDELRGVYCGKPIEPYNCHGCGHFLSTAELHEGETRCEACR